MLRLQSSRIAVRATVTQRQTCIRRFNHVRPSDNTPAYDGHIPLNWFENAFLAVGSAVMSLANPRRGGEHMLVTGFTQFAAE